MKNQIQELFSKEMTRKEFLQHIGAAVLIMFGVSGIIKALLGTQQNSSAKVGYGTSAYGGFGKG